MKKTVRKLNILLRNYFGFSRTETNALKVILPFLFCSLILYGSFNRRIAWWPDTEENDRIMLDSLVRNLKFKTKLVAKIDTQEYDNQPIYEFTEKFDPNKVDFDWLVAHGVPLDISRKWVNFLKSGGSFRRASDLSRIYGMTDSIFQFIQAHIFIPEKPKRVQFTPADINLADTTILKKVYGIGSTLASRIIRFRDALGGFISMEQLYEVYRLDSTVVERLSHRFFIADGYLPEQLTINTDSLEYLAKHPYISFQEAKLIIAFRKQHGNINDINVLLSLPLINEDKLKKLEPYLRVEIK